MKKRGLLRRAGKVRKKGEGYETSRGVKETWKERKDEKVGRRE